MVARFVNESSPGAIDEVQWGDVLVHVTVKVGDSIIESVITRRSAEEMALKRGDTVTAVIKATEVMLAKPDQLASAFVETVSIWFESI